MIITSRSFSPSVGPAYHKIFLGKLPIGSIQTSLRSGKFSLSVSLPGINNDKIEFGSTTEAMEMCERMVQDWLTRAGLKVNDDQSGH